MLDRRWRRKQWFLLRKHFVNQCIYFASHWFEAEWGKNLSGMQITAREKKGNKWATVRPADDVPVKRIVSCPRASLQLTKDSSNTRSRSIKQNNENVRCLFTFFHLSVMKGHWREQMVQRGTASVSFVRKIPPVLCSIAITCMIESPLCLRVCDCLPSRASSWIMPSNQDYSLVVILVSSAGWENERITSCPFSD